jgi:hypothetical protein
MFSAAMPRGIDSCRAHESYLLDRDETSSTFSVSFVIIAVIGEELSGQSRRCILHMKRVESRSKDCPRRFIRFMHLVSDYFDSRTA